MTRRQEQRLARSINYHNMNRDFINWAKAAAYAIATLGGISTSLVAKSYLGTFFVLILAVIGLPTFIDCIKALRGKKEE